MPTIADAIDYIQTTIISNLSGIRKAPNRPPEKLSHFPYFVCFPQQGVIERDYSAGYQKENHTLIGELHVARKDLPRDVSGTIPFLRSITSALQDDPTLGGNVNNLGNIDYSFSTLNWSDEKTIGFQFTIPVTQSPTLTDPVYDIGGAGDRPTLTDTLLAIQDAMDTLARNVPDYPPELLNYYPAIIAYPQSGQIIRVADWTKELHTVVIEAHVARKDLPRDVETAYPFARTIPNALLNDVSINCQANTINQIRYNFGSLGWADQGEVPTIGFRFQVDLKINV